MLCYFIYFAIVSCYKNYYYFLFLFFHKNYFNLFMFRDVPGCSGMFRNVPCSYIHALKHKVFIAWEHSQQNFVQSLHDGAQ